MERRNELVHFLGMKSQTWKLKTMLLYQRKLACFVTYFLNSKRIFHQRKSSSVPLLLTVWNPRRDLISFFVGECQYWWAVNELLLLTVGLLRFAFKDSKNVFYPLSVSLIWSHQVGNFFVRYYVKIKTLRLKLSGLPTSQLSSRCYTTSSMYGSNNKATNFLHLFPVKLKPTVIDLQQIYRSIFAV